MPGPKTVLDDDHADPLSGPDLAPEAQSQNQVLHDVRGQLSPALLSADRLSQHPDPKVRELAEQIIRSIEQAARRLKDLPLR